MSYSGEGTAGGQRLAWDGTERIWTPDPATPWTTTSGVIHPVVVLNPVAVGATTVIAGEQFRVVGSSRLEGDVLVKAHSAFTGSEWVTTTRGVQTTNATPTVAKTLPLADDSVYIVKAVVEARSITTATKRAVYEITAMVHREGGGLATLGAAGVQNDFTDETTPAWDATFTVSGSDVRISVTGEVGETINWATTLFFQRVSGAA